MTLKLADTQNLVAVKTITNSEGQKEYEQEVKIMRQLHHPNLVSLLHIVKGQPMGMVIEFVHGTSWDEWLSEQAEPPALLDLLFVLHQVTWMSVCFFDCIFDRDC